MLYVEAKSVIEATLGMSNTHEKEDATNQKVIEVKRTLCLVVILRWGGVGAVS